MLFFAAQSSDSASSGYPDFFFLDRQISRVTSAGAETPPGLNGVALAW
jgi:hypothetical protein